VRAEAHLPCDVIPPYLSPPSLFRTVLLVTPSRGLAAFPLHFLNHPFFFSLASASRLVIPFPPFSLSPLRPHTPRSSGSACRHATGLTAGSFFLPHPLQRQEQHAVFIDYPPPFQFQPKNRIQCLHNRTSIIPLYSDTPVLLCACVSSRTSSWENFRPPPPTTITLRLYSPEPCNNKSDAIRFFSIHRPVDAVPTSDQLLLFFFQCRRKDFALAV